MDGAAGADRRLCHPQDDRCRRPRRLGRGAGAQGLGRRVRALFRRKPGHRARGGDAVSRAGRHGMPARRHRRASCPHGPRPQGPPLCQGGDRDRGLRPRRTAARRAERAASRRRAATAHPGHPFDRADRLCGGRARGRAGGAGGHPHLQDQGRRRSRPRRRDGGAGAQRGRTQGRDCASTPTRAMRRPRMRSAPSGGWRAAI